jgi:alpha-L-arabinofuranosidase
MNRRIRWKAHFVTAAFACIITPTVNAQKDQPLIVKASEIKASVAPTMWGVFFEDINMGADGGIYAELVKNRSFEFAKPMMGWKVLGKPKTEGDFLVLNRQQAATANPRFLRITLHNNAKGTLGLSNEGFRGMGIKQEVGYDFSVLYRHASPPIKLHIELLDEAGKNIGGTTVVAAASKAWQKATGTFKAMATAQKAKLNIWVEGDGAIDLDMVSLFPQDTWKGRPGGMRADMIQMLADMKPGFLRFPGGCIVEGFDLSQRYRWKNTIGPIEERQLVINRWNFEFAHRPAPDYFQTFGLGFFEYFQLAEDIGAEPLPILNAGMACQFNTAELVPLEDLGTYVQDALDLIEFANDDSSTRWGRERVKMGHPDPFHLKFLGVGNENWGPQYIERLKVFTKAIKEKYPEIQLVNSAGTDPEFSPFSENGFSYLDSELRKMKVDIIDEHFYRRPEWFFQNAARYDKYPRNGPKIFAGEYAAQSQKPATAGNKNNWQSALSEAAFMTGMERNADVVVRASYAPLFAHVDAWQWTPDMVWIDNLKSYGTPNYYVQQLFSINKGTSVVPLLQEGKPLAGQDSLYASATIDKTTNELILKLVNASANPVSKTIAVDGVKKLGSAANITELKGKDLDAVNSLSEPEKVAPKESRIKVSGKKLSLPLAPYSFTVVRVKMS